MKDKQAETSQENVFFSRLEKEKIKLAALEDYKQKHEEEDPEAEQMCQKQRKVVEACRTEIKTAIHQLRDPVAEAILIRKYLNMEQVQDIIQNVQSATSCKKHSKSLQTIAVICSKIRCFSCK